MAAAVPLVGWRRISADARRFGQRVPISQLDGCWARDRTTRKRSFRGRGDPYYVLVVPQRILSTRVPSDLVRALDEAAPYGAPVLGRQVMVEKPVRSRVRFDGNWEVWTDEVRATLGGSVRLRRRHEEERGEH